MEKEKQLIAPSIIIHLLDHTHIDGNTYLTTPIYLEVLYIYYCIYHKETSISSLIN